MDQKQLDSSPSALKDVNQRLSQNMSTERQSRLTTQQLRKMDFSQLSEKEVALIEDLSTFTAHCEFIKMLMNRHTDIKKKEHFIKENSTMLTSDEFSCFNRAKYEYEYNTKHFAAFCIGITTTFGLGVGVWVLPSRKSPWKYAGIGLLVGTSLSYAFWRLQIFKYHNKMNDQFREIIRQKYEIQKSKSIRRIEAQ